VAVPVVAEAVDIPVAEAVDIPVAEEVTDVKHT
jgi:hypothetical protein